MKSKKEQILAQLQKKGEKWKFKSTFLSSPGLGGRPTLTPKGGCSKLFATCSTHPHLGTIPLVQQIPIKKRAVPTKTWLPPLAKNTPIPAKVGLGERRGKGRAGGGLPLWASHRYTPPQNKRPAILAMLRVHLKQLKIFLRGLQNVLPTVRLSRVVPTYFLNLSLGAAFLPPGRTGTLALWPAGTKLLWDKRSKGTSKRGSKVNKASLPRVINNKKNNSPKGKKLAFRQEDLVKKMSHFINIWCYLQIIFFSFHTLKQPMVVVGYPHLGCRPANSLISTPYFLFSNPLPLWGRGCASLCLFQAREGCFLIWVKTLDCYPWRGQTHRIFVPSGLSSVFVPTLEWRYSLHVTKGSAGTADSAIAWNAIKGVKVEVLALSFLPQLKRGGLKSGLLNLEERVSEASLPRVKKNRLPSSIRKSDADLFCKQEMPSPQTNNFYKYLGFCDYIVFKIVWKWCSRQHSNQSAQWIRCHYFYKLNGQSWVFALKKVLFHPTLLSTGEHKHSTPKG